MSRKKSHNENLQGRGHWTVVFDEVILSPAWKHLSFGARLLYVELRRRFHNNNGHVYCSLRDVEETLGHKDRNGIANWYRELQHFGFIVQTEGASLGLDGKGKAPHWRLTELPTRNANGADLTPATKDFLKWDGTVFEPHVPPSRRWNKDKQTALKRQNPGLHVATTVDCTSQPPTDCTSQPLADESGCNVESISAGSGGCNGESIFKLAISGCPKGDGGPGEQPSVEERRQFLDRNREAMPDGYINDAGEYVCTDPDEIEYMRRAQDFPPY